ncbi:hypothetical protein NMG60_11002938 [Bertholletia excelsa]
MESSIVIKVKHGNTLRRFNAYVNEDGKLDLDIARLKEKVLGLFSFSPSADFSLTYVDEDGDVVTLVDEEDLHDVMRQSLNPLRITVKLNAEKGLNSGIRSSASSTPVRTPRVQHPFPNLSSNAPEILKSIPDTYRESLSKLAHDLASNSAIPAPLLAKLVDCFTKMEHTGNSMNAMGASLNKGVDGTKVGQATSEVVRHATCQEPACKTNEKVDLEKGIRDMDPSISPACSSLNVNSGQPGDSSASRCPSENLSSVILCNADCDCKQAAAKLQVPSNLPATENKKVGKSDDLWKSTGVAGPMNHSTVDFKNTSSGGQSIMDFKSTISCGTLEAKFPSLNPVNECQISGLPVAGDPDVPSMQHDSHTPPCKGSYCHVGIICDGCEANPITGPRFKSKVKEDYDLCSTCFSEIGNEDDYIRIDQPIAPRHQYCLGGLCNQIQHPPLCAPNLPEVLRSGMKLNLDSDFVRDVNLPDGTIMAPLTPFTKIWKMRNTGNMEWPQGTQLVWIRGDKLSDVVSVELQIPSNGIPVNGELDVSVDFVAPELPGQYISYWRMASRSGQRFGQLIWVLVQVNASPKDSMCNDVYGLNLNYPPVGSSTTGAEMVNVNVEPMVGDGYPQLNNSGKAAVLVKPINNQEPDFHVNNTSDNGVLNHTNPNAPTLVSYPNIDISEVELIVPSHMTPATAVVPTSVPEASDSYGVEQTLLRELDEMGFKRVNLNKEILRKNKYNLELSVEDLCTAAMWGPVLKELEEMGFYDKEMNGRLLEKFDGSIDRVVMYLTTGEE